MASRDHQLRPKCIATTRERGGDSSDGNWKPQSAFRQALFSPDGTSIVTRSQDNCLRTFVLPTDLLEEPDDPKQLRSHASWKSGSNIQSHALYPGFDLQNPATTLVLNGSADVPIALRNALHYNTMHGSYPLVSSQTEAHLPPRSLIFTRTGEHFLAGSENALAVFDCSRTGEAPMKFTRLTPARKSHRGGLHGLTRKAFVSAMSISCEGILALGTTQREVALYDHDGLGSWASTFSMEGSGNGVSDVKWSPDGTYLLVSERQSDSVQVFDIRNTQQKVVDLVGRNADTPQPLYMDIIHTASGYEVWTGGTDGQVRMWSNPGSSAGEHLPDAELHLHDAPVASAVWHPSGAVLATASGQQLLPSRADESDSEDESSDGGQHHSVADNTLKIWSV
ncbi:Guanine nucleotide-binding protein negative regulator 1 [Pseudocercospora fuligena]|uniref:Guanine nucleotide-binding protein negative regulator 1 n=1 Tax=Pseudocercospora fuligena TaxID=685502 RepID=A0A8H6VLZ1_9PEZI|nr:Guanine nucleotide-binding protein negative regulator 1 [Pseudocercospora fuligena]